MNLLTYLLQSTMELYHEKLSGRGEVITSYFVLLIQMLVSQKDTALFWKERYQQKALNQFLSAFFPLLPLKETFFPNYPLPL